jgi:hypothetical protein
MLNPAVYEKLDFPTVTLVVCSEEKVAHRFDAFHTGQRSKRPQANLAS